MDFDPRDIDSRADELSGVDRERDLDPREVFTRDLHLPRGLEREIVRDRDREYTLRGSESRTLATVGAFRVVSSRDLRDSRNRELDPRSGDLRHLPYFDYEVHFPDLRIEYELDGRLDHVDAEVITQHYRGAHAASVARSGFKGFRGSSARVGGAPFDPDYAEELWY
jgi:hypothetical protein